MSVILLTIYMIFLCIFYAVSDCPINQPVPWINLVHVVQTRLPSKGLIIYKIIILNTYTYLISIIAE